jgi:hypothetical protein
MLQNKGISQSQGVSQRRKDCPDHTNNSSTQDKDINISGKVTDEDFSEPIIIHRKQKPTETQLPAESTTDASPGHDCSKKTCRPNIATPGLHHSFLLLLLLILIFKSH